MRHNGLARACGDVAGVDGASDATASLGRTPGRVVELRDVQLAVRPEREVDDRGPAGHDDRAGRAGAAVGVARARSHPPDTPDSLPRPQTRQLAHVVRTVP